MGYWRSIPDQEVNISEITRTAVLHVYTFEAFIAHESSFTSYI